MVGMAASKNLCFRLKTTKRSRVYHAVAVSLKIVAVGMRWFWMSAPAGLFDPHRIVSEHEASLAFS
jgi:hypothetical protein